MAMVTTPIPSRQRTADIAADLKQAESFEATEFTTLIERGQFCFDDPDEEAQFWQEMRADEQPRPVVYPRGVGEDGR